LKDAKSSKHVCYFIKKKKGKREKKRKVSGQDSQYVNCPIPTALSLTIRSQKGGERKKGRRKKEGEERGVDSSDIHRAPRHLVYKKGKRKKKGGGKGEKGGEEKEGK